MSNSPTRSTLAERVSALDVPVEACEEVETLCEMIFGDDCGHLENVRLAWEVPSSKAGREAEREGWRVYECDVVGLQFAVPHGAPIPVILADHYDSEGEHESILYRYVHPDLVEDREALHDRLLRHVQEEIQNSLASLSTSCNLLKALGELEELPDGASSHPYHPPSEDERIGYEPAEDERPLDTAQ